MPSITPRYLPAVGTKGYKPIGTDRYPITVTWVSPDANKIRFRQAKFTRIDNNGLSETQEYHIEDDVNVPEVNATLCKNGYYYTLGGMKNGQRLVIHNQYVAYLDPSF